MSHKKAKRIRAAVRQLLREGLSMRDPRLTEWTGASPRTVRRTIALHRRKAGEQ